MTETQKTIRLNKVAKEFNIGIKTIVEYLQKRGHAIDSTPNTRITPEQYSILSQAFQGERKVKEEADKIEITTNAGSSVVIEAPSSPGENSASKGDGDELTIRNYTQTRKKTPAVNTPSTDSDVQTENSQPSLSNDELHTQELVGEEKKSEVVEDTPIVNNREVAVEKELEEERLQKIDSEAKLNDEDSEKVSGLENESSHEANNAEETEPTDAIVASDLSNSVGNNGESAEDSHNDEVSDTNKSEQEESDELQDGELSEQPVVTDENKSPKLKVVKKIDLNLIDSRTRPSKKEKHQDASHPEKKSDKKQSAPQETKPQQQIKEPDAVQELDATTKGTNSNKPKEKQPEFIETVYTKLEGPKVVDKIDLSKIEDKSRVKSSDSEKKKRKRIKKDGFKVDTSNITGTDADSSKVNKPDNKQISKQGDKKQQKPTDKKSAQGNKKNKVEKKKVEVDDSSIEKQIKETLARLSPLGKSKSSKHNREKRQKVHQRLEEEQLREQQNQNVLQVTEFVTANQLATMMNIPVAKIISTCMSVGQFVTINQRLDAEIIQLIADEFGYKLNFVSADVVESISHVEEADNPDDLITRNPIVTVMGHVDHGKTSLLDYIRNTNVIAGEAGGITQHIGAYEVTTHGGRKITFLDTPGHEAFTAMRARGAKVTDIAIIVISADDKIMPQTVEAINHAQAAGVPIVFAINKIDKPGADPDRIKTELAGMNLLVEEWGGKYQSQDISAKKGTNVDLLLEKVLLQADIMELKGNPNKRAKGTVLESSLDKGRGYTAKILVEDGTIHQGDPVLAGSTSGRVKAMYNERNQLVKEAGPSQPVLLLGLNGAPQAGDTFNVMQSEKDAKDIATRRQQLQREQDNRTRKHITLDEIGRRIAIGDFKELNLIVKADVVGTVEALSDSLLKLSTEEVQVNVIHKAVGQITENDVQLAEASNAIIIGFQVRPSLQARKMAESEQIDIRLYSIIYDAINELKDAIEGMLSPETQTKITANLEIRETFKISKVGTVAGCMCLDGKVARGSNVRIIRDGIVIYTGKLASLRRFKDDVKEVFSGQDCGLNIENFNDIKVGDIIEAYEVIEIKRKI